MKILLKYLLVVLAVCLFAAVAVADETNSFESAISQAKAMKDVRPIISALPKAEELWSKNSEQYFTSMKEASHVLSGAVPTNANAYQAQLVIFTNVLSKPFPTNAAGLEAQYLTVMNCGHVVAETGQKLPLLHLAQFVREIRSRIIQNYVNKGVLLNGFGFTSQEIAQNTGNIAEDNLQATLRDANKILTFELLHGCAHFPSSNPANAEFVKQISDAAQLTDAERQKLSK